MIPETTTNEAPKVIAYAPSPDEMEIPANKPENNEEKQNNDQ